MLNFYAIRHAWPEKAGFRLRRDRGTWEYVFVHFTNEVEIILDGAYATVPAHSCVLYRPGTPQYIYSKQTLVHDWFHFSGNPSAPMNDAGVAPDTLLTPVRADFITDIVREMENEFLAKKKGYECLLNVKFAELMLKLGRAAEGDFPEVVDQTTSERLRKLRAKVFLSLGHPWTIEEMASDMGLSQSRFYNVYRSMYGSSPMDDLIHARIDSAKNALLFGTQPVSAIAEALGYNNVTHFIRQFRTITGTTPLRYRNGMEKENDEGPF